MLCDPPRRRHRYDAATAGRLCDHFEDDISMTLVLLGGDVTLLEDAINMTQVLLGGAVTLLEDDISMTLVLLGGAGTAGRCCDPLRRLHQYDPATAGR